MAAVSGLDSPTHRLLRTNTAVPTTAKNIADVGSGIAARNSAGDGRFLFLRPIGPLFGLDGFQLSLTDYAKHWNQSDEGYKEGDIGLRSCGDRRWLGTGTPLCRFLYLGLKCQR